MNPYKQCITYWAPGSFDGEGRRAFTAPEIIFGRWENRQEEFMDPMGKTLISKAIAFFPDGCEQSIPEIGGWLFLGNSDEDTPASQANAFEIKQMMITPDLRLVRNENRVIM